MLSAQTSCEEILVTVTTAAAAAEAAAITAATTTTAAEAATATAAAAEATTFAAAAAEAAAASALFLRTSLIDLEVTATEIGTVGLFDGNAGLIGRAHRNEGEATWAASEFVHRDENIGDRAKLSEVRAELVFGGLEGHVADV
jgi:membrane protein involved in colicin uptake